MDSFDPRTNFSHALECLKSALILQEENEVENAEKEENEVENAEKEEEENEVENAEKEEEEEEEEEMVATYLMLNLGSKEAVRWGLALDEKRR